MRRFCLGLVAAAITILVIAGCGSSNGGGETTTTASLAETSTTKSPATETSVTETPATQAPAAGEWTTIATLRSTDPAWQDLEGLLVSEPFTVTGDVQLVLDMPDAGRTDGVIVAFIPAEQATDAMALLAAIRDAVVVTLPAAYPTEVVPGLHGDYVLVNSVTTTATAWSLDAQTRP